MQVNTILWMLYYDRLSIKKHSYKNLSYNSKYITFTNLLEGLYFPVIKFHTSFLQPETQSLMCIMSIRKINILTSGKLKLLKIKISCLNIGGPSVTCVNWPFINNVYLSVTDCTRTVLIALELFAYSSPQVTRRCYKMGTQM